MQQDFVLFALGNLNSSGIFMYVSLYMDPYKYVVTASMKCVSNHFEIAKVIKKQNMIASMMREYLSL